jgi:hypothetical protein
MNLKIKKAELVPDTFGKHIKITMIGLYDENDKWVKWVKLDEEIIQTLLTKTICK